MAASEQDIREFRRILVEIGRSKWAKRSPLRRVALRFQRAVTALTHATRESSAGVYRSGGAIASQHGVGLATSSCALSW